VASNSFLSGIPPLSVARGCLTSISFENYVMFSGGKAERTTNTGFSAAVDVYDTSNLYSPTTMTLPSVPGARYYLTSTVVENKAIFSGGDNTYSVSAVDIFTFEKRTDCCIFPEDDTENPRDPVYFTFSGMSFDFYILPNGDTDDPWGASNIDFSNLLRVAEIINIEYVIFNL